MGVYHSKRLALSIGLLLTGAPLSHAEFDLGSALNETQMAKTGEYLAGFSLVNRLRGNNSYGKGLHIELAAQATLAKLKPLKDALGSPNNENLYGSVIGVPKVLIRLGYSYAALGVSFIPRVKIEGASVETLGADFKFNVGDWFDWPVKIDIRGHVGEIKLGYATIVTESMFTIPVEVGITFRTYGVGMGASYEIGGPVFSIEPYAAAGIVTKASDYGEAALIAGLIADTTVKHQYSKTGFHGTVGLAFNHFRRLTWAAELDRLGNLWYFSFGFNFRFR
jgi:hypothetical protein